MQHCASADAAISRPPASAPTVTIKDGLFVVFDMSRLLT